MWSGCCISQSIVHKLVLTLKVVIRIIRHTLEKLADHPHSAERGNPHTSIPPIRPSAFCSAAAGASPSTPLWPTCAEAENSVVLGCRVLVNARIPRSKGCSYTAVNHLSTKIDWQKFLGQTQVSAMHLKS